MPPVADQLPPPIRRFVNRRAELDALDRLTSTPRGGEAPVVIAHGMSGVGKTATSLHWAHVNRDRFADGRLYADLGRGGVESGDVLAVFLQALGVPLGAIPVTLAERVALFRSHMVGKRRLLLLDDVKHAAQVIPLIPSSAPESVVLVTSRESLGELQVNGAGCVELSPLDAENSRVLLALLIGERRVRAEPHAVEQLVDIAAGLPLALQISGARLTVNRRLELSSFIDDLLHAQQERIDVGAPGSVDLVFSGAYRALSPPAALLYRRLGAHPGSSFTSVVAEAAAGWPAEPIDDLLHELHGRLLVEDRGGWSRFHEPLLLHARGALALEEPEAEEEAAGRIVGYYADTVERMGRSIDFAWQLPAAPVGLRGVSDRHLSANVRLWFEVERENLAAVLRTATEHRWDTQAWRIAEALGPEYRRRGHHDEELVVYGLGARAARRSGDAAVEARMLMHLVHAHFALDDPTPVWLPFDAMTEIVERLTQSDAGLLERTIETLVASDMHVEAQSGVIPLLSTLSLDVVKVPYEASGGMSALLQVGGGATLRVEAHKGSFALVWPTHSSLAALADIVARPADTRHGANTKALVVDDEGAIQEGTFANLRARIADGDDNVQFARFDLADVVITWQHSADPALTEGEDTAHEIGLGAEYFDPQLLRELIETTAIATIASAAGKLVEEARAVLVAIPPGSLRGDEATSVEFDAS
jgi:NB-ARC domain-containing protein